MGRHGIDRRMVLRGLGAAIALPWLEAFAPSTAHAGPAGDAPPRRLVFLFSPNGMHMPEWTPRDEGEDFTFPSTLAAFTPLKPHVHVLSGLAHHKARANGDGPGDHARSSATFLTGAQAKKTSGGDIRVGVSVDQVAASRIGRATRFASLELGTERARQSGSCDSGYSCAYSSSISWRTPHTPMGKEIHPRLVFERLFALGDADLPPEIRERRRRTRRSVLDHVLEDARALDRRLGAADRRKVDEYLEAVREMERRLDAAEHSEDGQGLPDLDVPRRTPRDAREHLRLLFDLLALALQTDATRVATFMLANEGSNKSYPDLGVRDGHHQLSHHGGDEAKIAAIRVINHFHTGEVARFVDTLARTEEGDGSLLDQTAVVYGSGIGDGNRHNHDDLPILMAGRLGGTLPTGRHTRFPDDTPLCNLYVSLLERVGVEVASHGDSTGRLDLG